MKEMTTRLTFTWTVLVLHLIHAAIPITVNADENTIKAETQDIVLDQLTSADKQRIREILTGVIRQPNYLTPQIHTEFWSLMTKMGTPSDEDMRLLLDATVGAASKYMRYFYEDALWALSSGRPFKSHQREEYEQHLLKLGAITNWRITQNEELIQDIAYRIPIKSEGGEILFDESKIKEILGGLEEASRRLETLITK